MKPLSDFYFGPIASVRIYTLCRLLPMVLAFDIWLLMIGHAGRYGIAGFNVAHLAVLDRLLPVPSAASYIGVLVLAGLLCLLYAFGQRSRLVSLSMLALYTLSWAWSMLDSYQHHYFMSLVLLCMVLIEPDEAAHSPGSASPGSGGGYALLTSSVAVLYAYAALAKCDDAWLDGHTLRRISLAESTLEPVVAFASDFGITQQGVFTFFATAVIPIELILALAYAIAPLRDRSESGVLHRFFDGAWLLGLCLHLGAEALDLKIGWFSYYMLALSMLCLGPAGLLEVLAWPLRRLETAMLGLLRDVEGEVNRGGKGVPWAITALSIGFIAYVGHALDLPGAFAAAGVLGLGLATATVVAARGQAVARALSPQLTALAAALCLWLAISTSDVRFDFYRFLGGDQARRGETGAALQTYKRGERYAPEGKSRRSKIIELERDLGVR